MNPNQRLIGFIFVVTAIIETTLGCIAFDLLINTLGAEQLGFYLAYSAIISIGAVLLLTYLADKVSSLLQFLALHLLFAIFAAVCLFTTNEFLKARLVFISMVGLGTLIYFRDWSVATLFISPFESKRLYHWLGVALQIGVFIGAAFAIASPLGITHTQYFSGWLILEFILLVTAFYLMKEGPASKIRPSEVARGEQPVNLLKLFRYYKWVPKITLWVVIWGFVIKSMDSLVGYNFEKSGYDLTALYGVLTLATAVLSGLVSAVIYPKFLKWVRLSAILLASTVIYFVFGSTYLILNTFILAVIITVLFDIVDSSFVEVSISTEFGIYPHAHRDQIRLLADTLSSSVGAALVGILFIFPRYVVVPVLLIVLAFWVLVGIMSRNGFIREIIGFLKDPDFEKLGNAIALYDELENREGYRRIIELLSGKNHLPTSIQILNTFSSLGTIKPVPEVIKLLESDAPDPLKIAAMHYFENIPFKKLDPFLQYQTLNTLKDLCRSRTSNILRAMAVKVLIENGPIELTVGFILEALQSKDERMVANAIGGLNYIQYPGTKATLMPFLSHRVPRVRANAIIALWKYTEVREETKAALEGMLRSLKNEEVISGVYAAGEVKDNSCVEFLLSKAKDPNKGLQRGVPIALLKLGNEAYYKRVVEMILGSDESQAINVCYLSLRLDPRILNELIIADLFKSGEGQRKLALERYSRCGGFCREQLELLSGKIMNREGLVP